MQVSFGLFAVDLASYSLLVYSDTHETWYWCLFLRLRLWRLSCEEVQGFRDSRYAHVTAWPEVRKHDPGLLHVEYEQAPRGRVLMSGGAFRVFLPPKMVNNQTVRRLIMRAFNLPDGAKFIGDEHYQDPADIDWED